MLKCSPDMLYVTAFHEFLDIITKLTLSIGTCGILERSQLCILHSDGNLCNQSGPLANQHWDWSAVDGSHLNARTIVAQTYTGQ